MVALVVLSAGIVTVYRSFFLCVDYLNNITTRIYASHLMDQRMADISLSFAQSPVTEMNMGPLVEVVPINHKNVSFAFDVRLTPEGWGRLWLAEVGVSWFDGRRNMHAKRLSYLSK